MKTEIKSLPPIEPPKVVLVELTMDEAIDIKKFMNHSNRLIDAYNKLNLVDGLQLKDGIKQLLFNLWNSLDDAGVK